MFDEIVGNVSCDDYLEICDLCGDFFDIQQIRLTESGQMLCDKCMAEPSEGMKFHKLC